MSPALTTFLFELANFLVLAGVLTWLLFRPVRAVLEERQQSIAQERQQAEAKLAEAEQIRAEIKQRLADLEHELTQKQEASREQAEQTARKIVAEAHEAAERERAALDWQRASLDRTRLEGLSRAVAETAGQAVRRLLTTIADADLNTALLNSACREVQSFDGNSLAPVVVESAWELSDDQRSTLKNAVGSASDSVEFHVSEELRAGLRVSTNRGLIDCSDRGLSEYARGILESKLSPDSNSNGNPFQHD